MKNCSVFASLISPSKMILFEKKYQTFDTDETQMKHLEVRQKYTAARGIFNSLLGVSSGDETLRLMFDILLQTQARGEQPVTPKNVVMAFSSLVLLPGTLKVSLGTPKKCLFYLALLNHFHLILTIKSQHEGKYPFMQVLVFGW